MRRLTFLRAKEAVWPPRTSRTAMRLRCILLTAMGMKWPRGSGPSINVSFNLITPFRVVPDTTVPTPYKPFNIVIISIRTEFVRCIIKYSMI